MEWTITGGVNSLLGVVDTNIDDREYIVHKQLFGYNDNKKHSESVLGIILDKNIKGMADKTKVCFAGVAMDSGTYDNFIQALRWIKQFDLDVFNLSLAYKDDNVEIRELLLEISKKAIIVSAYSDVLTYPHSYDFIVSVGNTTGQDVDIVMETGFGRNKELYKGTSMSCAFISSLACLAKSFDKSIDRKVFVEKICGSKTLDVKSQYDNRRQLNIVL